MRFGDLRLERERVLKVRDSLGQPAHGLEQETEIVAGGRGVRPHCERLIVVVDRFVEPALAAAGGRQVEQRLE
jgi:hypothetical protein